RDVATGRERATLEGHGSLVTAVVASPDGSLLASASFDQTIRLWNAATGGALGRPPGDTDQVRTRAVFPHRRVPRTAGDHRESRAVGGTAQAAASPASERPYRIGLRGGLLPRREDAVLGLHGPDHPRMGLARGSGPCGLARGRSGLLPGRLPGRPDPGRGAQG